MRAATIAAGALGALVGFTSVACGSDEGALSPGADTAADTADGHAGAGAGDAAQGSDADALEPEPRADFAFDVLADGPFDVGYHHFETTYDPPGLDAPRTLELHVWYPSTDTSGETPTYVGLFEDDDVWVDAAVADPVVGDAGYPVHVYSHGSQGWAANSADLMRAFASHGWVVVAPDHTGNLISDGPDRDPWMFYVRSFDISHTLDAMAALPEDAPVLGPLAGRMALDRVYMSGHSYGGYTTFGTAGASFDIDAIKAGCVAQSGPAGGPCEPAWLDIFEAGVRDARVVAAVTMAAGNFEMYGAGGYATIGVPLLQMSGDADIQVPNATQSDPVWAALKAAALPRTARVDIAGACHLTFSVGSCGGLPDDPGFPIVNSYSLAWARRFLLGDTTDTVVGLVEGSVQPWEEVTYEATSDAAFQAPAP